MPTLPFSSSPAALPASAALPSVAIRRHGLYLAAIGAYFRATGALKNSSRAALPPRFPRPSPPAAAS